MDCPACKKPMITLQLGDVEIDHCLSCKGIWLDSGELEMLLDDSDQAKKLLESFSPAKKTSEEPRKCPICLKKMQKIIVGPDNSTLLIDSCKKGHGLWFDKGELQDVLKMGTFDEEGKVQKLLVDIFAGQDCELYPSG